MAEISAVAKEIARRLENVLTVAPGIAARIVDEELAAHAPQSAPVPEAGEDPYFTEVDNNGCSHCGSGRTWNVIGPDGVALSTSYEDEDAAIDLADMLNEAFARGASSRDKEIASLLAALEVAERA